MANATVNLDMVDEDAMNVSQTIGVIHEWNAFVSLIPSFGISSY